jgi:putative addiction module component (TIGR02574 family)
MADRLVRRERRENHVRVNSEDELTAAVLAMPEEARARLIDKALASFGDPGPLSEAWKTELDRREAEYQDGRVELIDNEEVFESVRESLRKGAAEPREDE